MSTRLFVLEVRYPGLEEPHAIYSTSPAILRLMGKNHQKAGALKPRLRLKGPDGTVMARMNEWDRDWSVTTA